jgi:transcriptional regulator with XRE-family HTH domain
MKDMNDIMKGSAEDFNYIGERLRSIRDELIANDSGNKRTSDFSRKNLAERFGIDYYTLTNVERGTFSYTSIKMVLYYYSLGYNPAWILSPDNEFIPKHNIGENVVYQNDVQEEYRELESAIVTALMEFKKKI